MSRFITRSAWAAGFLTLLCFCSSPAAAQDASEEQAEVSETGFSASMAVASDFRFRGVSLSDRKPALQAGADYTHASGLFIGAWASTIADADADTEVDLFVGYSGSAASLDYTITATKYLYPGAGGLTYVELQSLFEAPLGPAGLSLEFACTPEQKNAVRSVYGAVGASYEGPYAITMFGKVGHEDGAYDRKWDWQAGLRRSFGAGTVEAAYVATNRKAAALGKAGKPALVVSAALSL